MTPFIAPPAPRQAAAVAPAHKQTPDASAANDPFAVHLDAAAEKAAAKSRPDKPAAGAKPARPASVQKSSKPQKPQKDAAKKPAENIPQDEARENADSAQAADDQPEPSAADDSNQTPTPQDACHQQDSLFAQPLLNQPAPAEEIAQPQAEAESEDQKPAAALQIPAPSQDSQPAEKNPPGAKAEKLAPQSKAAAKLDLPEKTPAHKTPVPAATKEAAAPEPQPESAAEKKPAPRAGLSHLAPKNETERAAAPKNESVAPAPAADLLAAEAPKPPEPAPQPDEPAPAPMPIPVLQSAHEPAAQGAETTRPAQDSPQPAPEKTFDQIVLGLRTKMDAANQKAQIELNPPNLGKLHVSVQLSNGVLTAQFRTSTDVVRDLLSSHMDQLRTVLEGQGIAVDKLAVSAGSAPGESNPQTNSSASQNHDGRSGGAFSNDRHSPRQSPDGAFTKMWRDALGKNEEEPIDLLA